MKLEASHRVSLRRCVCALRFTHTSVPIPLYCSNTYPYRLYNAPSTLTAASSSDAASSSQAASTTTHIPHGADSHEGGGGGDEPILYANNRHFMTLIIVERMNPTLDDESADEWDLERGQQQRYRYVKIDRFFVAGMRCASPISIIQLTPTAYR